MKSGTIIAMSGGLGAGKTTFIQGLAEGLGVKTKIISPTFILMRTYKRDGKPNFYHVDVYRLEGDVKKEVENLGLFDVWRGNNIIAIEWAEKIKELLPKETMWISFENVSENERKIVIQ